MEEQCRKCWGGGGQQIQWGSTDKRRNNKGQRNSLGIRYILFVTGPNLIPPVASHSLSALWAQPGGPFTPPNLSCWERSLGPNYYTRLTWPSEEAAKMGNTKNRGVKELI